MDISIVVICHHDRGYLEQALRSARRQDFRGSFEVVLQQSDMTMAQNTNAGVKKCKGEYVKWLHDDDLLMQDCLTNLWQARGSDVICANAMNVYEQDGETIEGMDEVVCSFLPTTLNEMVEDYAIHAGTLMYRRQVLLDNPLDESLWTGEEFELNLRLFKKGYKFAYVDKLVSRYRVHSQMKSYSAYGHVAEGVKLKRWDELERIRDFYR